MSIGGAGRINPRRLAFPEKEMPKPFGHTRRFVHPMNHDASSSGGRAFFAQRCNNLLFWTEMWQVRGQPASRWPVPAVAPHSAFSSV